MLKKLLKNTIKKTKKWFTMVELIIVIGILSIVWTIWFWSYSSYSLTARDAYRIEEITNIWNALNLYSVRYDLPLPTSSMQIKTWSLLLWYQWNAWDDVLNKIFYKKWWKDPITGAYFKYYINSRKQKFQLLVFLEQNNATDIVYTFPFIDKSYASYSDSFPYVYSDDIWILLKQWTNEPIDELPEYKDAIFDFSWSVIDVVEY